MIKNITEYLDNIVKIYPDKIGFCSESETLTFRELQEQAHKIATAIINKQLFRSPIVIATNNKLYSIISFMAVAYSGNFYVPIDREMPAARLEKILKTLNSPMIITDDEANGDFVSRLLLAGADGRHLNSFYELRNTTAIRDLVNSVKNQQVDTDLLYVLFTSGSTGTPKGVSISHRSVIDYTEWYSDTFGIDNSTIYGAQTPLFFDMSISELFSTIKQGCKTIYIPKKLFMSPSKLIDLLNDNKVNTIFWVPFPLCTIANLGLLKKKPPSYLRKVLFAGEAMPNKQLNMWRKALPEILYANCFGPTEIANIFAYYIVDRDFEDDEPLPIGTACRNIDILVINDENTLVKGNEIGEICVRGSCLSAGYYGDMELTQKVFVQNPTHNNYYDIVYRTGDLGFYNQNQELCFAGRKNYQIKHKGYRIELGEIEMAASSFESVSACVALYDKGQSKIHLFVTPGTVETKDLFNHLKMALPHYMLPYSIKTMEFLPVNHNGKIDRKKLMEAFK